MHRRLILLCILLFTLTLGASRTCYAQDFTIQVQVPSPTAAELGKYGDIPVSLYTGVPKIEVPVYTVETPKLSLPISLSYHASGIRVGQEASVVGLGWSLNAGGVITRVMRGQPDDVRDGFLYKGRDRLDAAKSGLMGTPPYTLSNEYLLDLVQQGTNLPMDKLDPQADMFMFNFAGYAGKFVFDGTEIRTIPYQPFQIEYFEGPVVGSAQHESSGSILSWAITAPNGTKYFFEARERYYQGPVALDYATAWYLTKVQSASGVDDIVLEYESIPSGGGSYGNLIVSSYDHSKRQHFYWFWKNNSFMRHDPPVSQSQTMLILETYLRKITWTGGHIMVGRSSREDAEPNSGATIQKYDALTVYSTASGTAQRVQKTTLGYSYFTSSTDLRGYSGSANRNTKRLRLDNVQMYGETDTDVQPPYTFAYNSSGATGQTPLPPLNSRAEDHWGFYNGQHANDTRDESVPAFIFTSPIYSSRTITYSGVGTNPTGALREPDATAQATNMQVGMLTKITYPTGGYTAFEYEPHQYSNFVETGTERIAPMGYDAQLRSGDGRVKVNAAVGFYLESGASGTAPSVLVHRIVNGVVQQPAAWELKATDPLVASFYSGGQVFREIPLDLPQGTYRLSSNEPCSGCVAAVDFEWKEPVQATPKRAGGLRIKRITTHDGMSTAGNIVKEYSYSGNRMSLLGASSQTSSGFLVNEPRYLYYGNSGYQGNEEFLHAFDSDVITTGSGSHIGYAQVSVKQTGHGETVHFFLAPGGNYHNGQITLASDLYPGVEQGRSYSTSYDWKRGTPLLTTQYDQAGEKLSEVRYEYVFTDTEATTSPYSTLRWRIPSINFELYNSNATTWNPGVERVADYNFFDTVSGNVLLQSKVETVYNPL